MEGGLAFSRSTSSFHADIGILKTFMYRVLKKINMQKKKTQNHTSVEMDYCIYMHLHTSLNKVFKSTTLCNSCKQNKYRLMMNIWHSFTRKWKRSRGEHEAYFFRILATSVHLGPSHQYGCLHLLFQIRLFFLFKV